MFLLRQEIEYPTEFLFISYTLISTTTDWRTLLLEDTGLGGKGGERGGGGNEGTNNDFGATPYFLVIADDQEGWEAFSSVIIISHFLDRLLIICEAQMFFLYLTRNKTISRLFLLSWFGFEIKELLHIINQTLVSLRLTLLYTILHYFTLFYTTV